MNEIFVRDSGIRLRSEPFGGFAWRPNGPVQKLAHGHMQLLYALNKPRRLSELQQSLQGDTLAEWNDLVSHGLVHNVQVHPEVLGDDELSSINNRIMTARGRSLMRPFWVHIQPFTFCNQRCVHCYCDAGPEALPFLAYSVQTWKEVIDKLIDFGVWDIYVTGGENLIVEECFDLVGYIIHKGATPAISTNGMRVTQGNLDRIRELGLSIIQVSLDGANEQTNDFMRGSKGAFRKTIEGIRMLSSVTKPVINCVVSRVNRHEVEQLVVLGKSLGVTYFKFFPQKLAGRAQVADILTDSDIFELIGECRNIAVKYEVRIETFDLEKPCGSGTTGFAVNENLDVMPCIFGTHENRHVCGNLLHDDLEEIWFGSPVLSNFRGMRAEQPCHRCEPKLDKEG